MRCPRVVHLLFEMLSHMCLAQDGISYVKAYACHWSQMADNICLEWNICESFAYQKLMNTNSVLVPFWAINRWVGLIVETVSAKQSSVAALSDAFCLHLTLKHTHSPLWHYHTRQHIFTGGGVGVLEALLIDPLAQNFFFHSTGG